MKSVQPHASEAMQSPTTTYLIEEHVVETRSIVSVVSNYKGIRSVTRTTSSSSLSSLTSTSRYDYEQRGAVTNFRPRARAGRTAAPPSAFHTPAASALSSRDRPGRSGFQTSHTPLPHAEPYPDYASHTKDAVQDSGPRSERGPSSLPPPPIPPKPKSYYNTFSSQSSSHRESSISIVTPAECAAESPTAAGTTSGSTYLNHRDYYHNHRYCSSEPGHGSGGSALDSDQHRSQHTRYYHGSVTNPSSRPSSTSIRSYQPPPSSFPSQSRSLWERHSADTSPSSSGTMSHYKPWSTLNTGMPYPNTSGSRKNGSPRFSLSGDASPVVDQRPQFHQLPSPPPPPPPPQRQRLPSISLSISSKSSRNKLRKEPPPTHHQHQHTQYQNRGRTTTSPSGHLETPPGVTTFNLTRIPSNSNSNNTLATRGLGRGQHRAYSEMEYHGGDGYKHRTCVSDSGHATFTTSQLQFASNSEQPPSEPPSRHPTVSSMESSASHHHRRSSHEGEEIILGDGKSERGRRPRQPTFRSSSTAHTSYTTSSSGSSGSSRSGGTASTAPTSLSSSDWAGRVAVDGTKALETEESRSLRRGRSRSQSMPRKLVKKRPSSRVPQGGDTTTTSPPSSPHARQGPQLPLSSPSVVPLTLTPFTPLVEGREQTKEERKRSKSILGLRFPFTKGKRKRKWEGAAEESRVNGPDAPLSTNSPVSYTNPPSPPVSSGTSVRSLLFSPFSAFTSSPHSNTTSPASPTVLSPPLVSEPLPFPTGTSSPKPRKKTLSVEEFGYAGRSRTDHGALTNPALEEVTTRLRRLSMRERWGSRPTSQGLRLDQEDQGRRGGEHDTSLLREPSRSSRHERIDTNKNDAAATGRVGYDERMRRWTLAMTDLPDEVLVVELERLRMQMRKQEAGALMGSAVEGEETEWVEFGAREKLESVTASEHALVYGPSRLPGTEGRGHRARGGGAEVGGKFRIGSVEDGDDEDDESIFSSCENGFSASCYSEGHAGSSRHYAPDIYPIHNLGGVTGIDWKTARRALLSCRDIVRTERSYLSSLYQLLSGTDVTLPNSMVSGTTSNSIPLLIYTYLPDLVRASEAFLARLEEDWSAWGVSAALLGCEEEMEGAFVRWCGVVGEVFVNRESQQEELRHSESHHHHKKFGGRRVSSGLSLHMPSFGGLYHGGYHHRGGHGGGSGENGLKERSKSGAAVGMVELESVYRPRVRATSCYGGVPPSHPSRPYAELQQQQGMFTAALGDGLAYGLSPTTSAHRHYHPHHLHRQPIDASGCQVQPPDVGHRISFSRTMEKLSRTIGGKDRGQKESEEDERKQVIVRELAIQPIQRVTRYVLQYRALLKYTPTSSPSRALVERALETAARIAERCDRAQGNAAFLRR